MNKGVFWVFSLMILLFLGLSSCNEKEERRILVVHSYENTNASYPDFDQMIAAQFKKGNIRPDIRTLYLDCESYQEGPELQRMLFLVDSVSKGWQPEIILVNEDQATYSLLKCGAPLVKNVPIVFAGVNYPNWNLLKEFSNVTGFQDKIDFVENVNVAKEFFGEKIRLFAILDSTYLDMQIRMDIKKQCKGHKITGFMNHSEILPKQRQKMFAKEGYTYFYTIQARSGKENTDASLMWLLSKYEKNRCYVQIKRDFTTVNTGNICASPSLTMINEAFGYGEKLLGGYITTLPIQVEEEVKAAVQILNGRRPSDMPIIESRKEYVVDWKVMQKLGIKKSDIPARYKIINIPLNARYPILWAASIVIIVVFLCTLFASLLWLYLREQKRRKNALIALASEKEALALAIESGTTYVWQMLNGYFIFENSFWKSLGIAPKELYFKDLRSYIHPDHWSELESYWKSIKDAQKKIARLRCDFDGKGYRWWEFRYTTQQIEGDEFKTTGLLLCIQDLKDREAELEAARLLAEKAELKQSFLANMSHEIRTPLNSIVGFANILALEEELESEERQEYIDTINKNSELLLKLINDILELSRIESGYMSFSYKKCLVGELVDDIYLTHQVLISPRLKFLKETDNLNLEINVDKDRLTQVLTNFLNNASKFTESGFIKLGYRYLPEKNSVCIYVSDTGRGITREEQMMIFSRFYKQNEFSQGAGLGLSICQVIIEKLGGKIELQSEQGKGSCFMVVLPCRVIYDDLSPSSPDISPVTG